MANQMQYCKENWTGRMECREYTSGDWLVLLFGCSYVVFLVRWVRWMVRDICDHEDSDTDSLPDALFVDHAWSTATVETLAYSGDGNDDAWSACGTEAGEE